MVPNQITVALIDNENNFWSEILFLQECSHCCLKLNGLLCPFSFFFFFYHSKLNPLKLLTVLEQMGAVYKLNLVVKELSYWNISLIIIIWHFIDLKNE